MDPALTGFAISTGAGTEVSVDMGTGVENSNNQQAANTDTVMSANVDAAISSQVVAKTAAGSDADADAVDPFGDGNPPDPPTSEKAPAQLSQASVGVSPGRKDSNNGEFEGFAELEKEAPAGEVDTNMH